MGGGGEKDFLKIKAAENRRRNKKLAIIFTACIAMLSIFYLCINELPGEFKLATAILLIIKLLGLGISIILLIYEIDKSNSFVKSICTAGRQTNCNAVLQSNASKILGISWSEVGFYYFASSVLLLLFPGVDISIKVAALSVATALTMPYIFFSVYYQWRVIKQWCPLCVSVQAVLLIEFIWSIEIFWQTPYLSALTISLALCIFICIGLPFVAWYSLKPVLLMAKNQPLYEAAYKRLLHNPDTFNSLLLQQQSAPDGLQEIGITIGNPNAGNTILKVCNPYCGPCAKAHPVLEEIIHQNKDVKVKLIFTAGNDPGDKRGVVARHLLAVNAKGNSAITQQALDDWYLADKKDYDVFAAKYPMNGELKNQEITLEKMGKWCKEAEIVGTPTFFINGRRLPENYRIEELKYIL